MSRILSMSIRTQLLFMALIVALPAVGSILYSSLKFRQSAIDDAIEGSKKLGDSIANEQRHLAVSAEQLMSALAQLPEIRSHNAFRVQKIFRDILKLNPQYLNIAVADRGGIVWASAVSSKPVSMADRRYFKNAMATGQLSSGEYVVSRIISSPTINLCYPIKNNNGVIDGAMTVALNLEHLSQDIDQTVLKGYSYSIADHNGIILSRSLEPKNSIGQKDSAKIFKQMQGPGTEGSIIGYGLDGKKKFITYRKLYLKGEPTPYLYIRAGIPIELVVADANSVLVHNLLSYATGLILAFSLAWLTGKRWIVDRLSSLQDAARRLASGDLQVRVSDSVKGGEIGNLGQAFDEMAQHLADREKERDTAESALRKSAAHYRSIFDNSLFGIALTGLDRQFVQVNETFCELLEYSEEELIGLKGLPELTHPDDVGPGREKYLKMVQRELEHYTLEQRYVTKSRRVVRAMSFIQGFYGEDGRYAGHSCCILDVTEMKHSEERMRLFFERQLVGTAIMSPGKCWIMTNEALQRMLGYTAQELAEMTCEELTEPADLEKDRVHFDKLLSGEVDAFSHEKRFVRKDGSLLHSEVSVGCVRKHDGSTDYILASINDITLRKQAEEEIRQLHASLEQRVVERTLQLEAATKEQESFSYSVSHDLRSPLRHINSYLSILTEEFAGRFPAEARYYMDRVSAASIKMGKLIDDLLELSRVGRADFVKESVDLSELAQCISVMLQETEPERAVEIVIAQDLSAQGDKNLLCLVLLNLIGNAWKYTSEKQLARLEFGEKVLAGRRAFFVKDNGAGFDMAYQDKLFGAFQRLHGDEYEGTGIGLATVKRIMERHGGSVWGEAEVGSGATFYFSIP